MIQLHTITPGVPLSYRWALSTSVGLSCHTILPSTLSILSKALPMRTCTSALHPPFWWIFFRVSSIFIQLSGRLKKGLTLALGVLALYRIHYINTQPSLDILHVYFCRGRAFNKAEFRCWNRLENIKQYFWSLSRWTFQGYPNWANVSGSKTIIVYSRGKYWYIPVKYLLFDLSLACILTENKYEKSNYPSGMSGVSWNPTISLSLCFLLVQCHSNKHHIHNIHVENSLYHS